MLFTTINVKLKSKLKEIINTGFFNKLGWSGGAKVLGKLSVSGRPTSLDDSRARVGVGGGCLDIFSLVYLFCFLSPSLWETARYRLKYCLKGPFNSKHPTNQSFTKREKSV